MRGRKSILTLKRDRSTIQVYTLFLDTFTMTSLLINRSTIHYTTLIVKWLHDYRLVVLDDYISLWVDKSAILYTTFYTILE